MVGAYWILWFVFSWGCFAGSVHSDPAVSGCFDVLKSDFLFNSSNESLRLKLTTGSSEEESGWLVILYQPSDLISYTLPHKSFLKDRRWVWDRRYDDGEMESSLECIIRTIGSKHFKDNNRAVFAKLDKDHPIAELPFQEGGMYCYDAIDEYYDDSTIEVSINHPRSWLASRDQIDLYEYLFVSFFSWLMIYPLISKWNNTKSTLKMSLRIKQMVYWYYIPCYVLTPLFERVIPTIFLGIWGDVALFSNKNVQHYFDLIVDIVIVLCDSLESLYTLLVSHGFDVLPRDTFLLFSKQYRMAWILAGLDLTFKIFAALGFSTATVLKNIFLFPTLFFMLNRYTKTKKLASTISLSYPRRLKALFEFYIWFFVYLAIHVIASMVNIHILERKIDISKYSGWRYVLDQLYDGLFTSILTAAYLNKYWTPEAIESDMTGSLKVDQQTVDYELDTIKKD